MAYGIDGEPGDPRCGPGADGETAHPPVGPRRRDGDLQDRGGGELRVAERAGQREPAPGAVNALGPVGERAAAPVAADPDRRAGGWVRDDEPDHRGRAYGVDFLKLDGGADAREVCVVAVAVLIDSVARRVLGAGVHRAGGVVAVGARCARVAVGVAVEVDGIVAVAVLVDAVVRDI